VLYGQGFCGFQLNDQSVLNQQVGEILTDQSPILIEYPKRMLLLGLEAELLQPMAKSIFIDFLQVTMTKIDMDVERGLPNSIA